MDDKELKRHATAKTLAFVTLLAIFFTTVMLFAQLQELGIVGRATTQSRTGQAAVAIIGFAAITVTGGIDFGDGYVNTTTFSFAELLSAVSSNYTMGGNLTFETNYTVNSSAGSWVNSTGGNTIGQNTTFPQLNVTNAGNINLSLNVTASSTAAAWFCTGSNLTFVNQKIRANRSVNSNSFLSICTIELMDLLTNTQTGNKTLCDGTTDRTGFVRNETVDVQLRIQIDAGCPATRSEVNNTLTFTGLIV